MPPKQPNTSPFPTLVRRRIVDPGGGTWFKWDATGLTMTAEILIFRDGQKGRVVDLRKEDGTVVSASMPTKLERLLIAAGGVGAIVEIIYLGPNIPTPQGRMKDFEVHWLGVTD